MSIRMRRPETVKLDISRGDWLVVKKHLTTGEQMDAFDRMMRRGVTPDQGDRLDALKVGLGQVAAYLVDWSFQDLDGKPLVIDGKPEEEVWKILEALPADEFAEVNKAIEAHIEQVKAELEAQKNGVGESGSSPISPSVAT